MYACDCVRAHACVFTSECTRVLFIHSNLKREIRIVHVLNYFILLIYVQMKNVFL